jgi:hypothetical protein
VVSSPLLPLPPPPPPPPLPPPPPRANRARAEADYDERRMIGRYARLYGEAIGDPRAFSASLDSF